VGGPQVPVQEPDPGLVRDQPAGVGDVLEGGPVLGHVQRQGRVVAVQPPQQLVQARGVDLPAEGGPGPVAGHELDVAGPDPGRRRAAEAGPLRPGGHHPAPVVVDAEEVEGRGHRGQVGLAHPVQAAQAAQVIEHVVGVAAAEQRVEEQPVVEAVDAPGGVGVARVVRGRGDRVEVEVDAEPGAGVQGPHRRGRAAVGQQQVVDGPRGRGRVLDPGRVHASGVAQEGRAPGLVQGRPVAHPVGQGPVDRGRVLGEAVDHLAAGPAAGVLEGLGQIPVVEGDPGLDPALQQAVGQPPVEVEAGLVDRPAAVGLDPRPGDREPVGPQPQVGHEGRVLAVAVVVVGGHLAGVAAGDPPGGAGEGVPDRGAAAALAGRPLDLVGGGGGAPDEAGREARLGGHPGRPLPNCEWL